MINFGKIDYFLNIKFRASAHARGYRATHILAAISAGFLVEGVHQMFGGRLFEGRIEILLLDKALKFGVIFQLIKL